jgi:hypothetical protein
MKTIWQPDAERDLRARLARLTPDAERRWGTMTAHRMICHLIDALTVPLGDVPVTVRKKFTTNPLIRHVMLFWLPWPKGKIRTMREFLVTQPAEWNADVKRFGDVITRVVERGRQGSGFGPHPAFGQLSHQQWGALMYKHADYHFKQFGV